ncbi:MAG: hypothetical protein P1V35_09955 [Planctomycetota bacterium]|nr:hypothetical protein [Planctomycetota bacterium]
MRPLQSLTLALLLTLFFSSCATITRGSTDSVIVRTQPSGAQVTLSNGMTGTSPASFELPRKHTVVVNICKPGFQPVEVTLNPVMTGEGGTHMAGNLLAGGLIGAAVDAGSGAIYDLTPNPLEVTLVPIPGHNGNYDRPYDESMREFHGDLAQAIRDEDLQDFEMDEAYEMEHEAYLEARRAAYDAEDMSDIPMDAPEEYGHVPASPDEPEYEGPAIPHQTDLPPGTETQPVVPAPGVTPTAENTGPRPQATPSHRPAQATKKEKGVLKFE